MGGCKMLKPLQSWKHNIFTPKQFFVAVFLKARFVNIIHEALPNMHCNGESPYNSAKEASLQNILSYPSYDGCSLLKQRGLLSKSDIFQLWWHKREGVSLKVLGGGEGVVAIMQRGNWGYL